MNSPAEAFNSIFNEKGGRLTSMPESLDIELRNTRPRMSMWVERLTHNLKAQNMPELYLDFIDNPSFNAAAIEKDGYGHIGIFWATPVIIGDVFGRMFSHPKVLPFLGNAEEEYLDPQWQYGVNPGRSNLLSRFWSEINADKEFAWVSVPRDTIRLKVAALCSTLAMDFLCIHELAHVGYGHTTYLKNKSQIPFLLEVDPSTYGPDVQITRQALEMSADALAASLSLDAFLRDRGQIIKSIPEVKFISDDEMAIFLWVFACGSLFFMFNPTCDINSLESRSHPPAAVRLKGNLNCALDNIAGRYDNPKEVFHKAINALGDVANALKYIGETSSVHTIGETVRNAPRLEEYEKKIVARFESLKPELAPYSHFNLQ